MTKKNEVQNAEVVTTEVTPASQISAIANDTSKNVSIRIRELFALTGKYGEVKKALDAAGYMTKNGTPIRFQHVRNVILTVAKKPAVTTKA
jgi:hypothetical protein